MRSRFIILPLMVALFSVLAIVGWEHSFSLGWERLFDGPPMPGMFGTTARDFRPETPARKEERLRRDRDVLMELKWSRRGTQASATLALLGAIVLVWRRRKNPLRWRLLSGSLALVALAIFGFVLAN
jgi:hypothetical protein